MKLFLFVISFAILFLSTILYVVNSLFWEGNLWSLIPLAALLLVTWRLWKVAKFYTEKRNVLENSEEIIDNYSWPHFLHRFDVLISEDQLRDVAERLEMDPTRFKRWLHTTVID